MAGVVLALAACTAAPGIPQPNGLAATSPMGWSSWNHYGCNVTEADVKAAADALVRDGLREAGYRYVDLDDCWQAPARDADGRLQADPTRFPDGIRALADYVHARGLLFGLYATPGKRTCAEQFNDYPGELGSRGHETTDARTFAGWGVDLLKYDWCYADRDGADRRDAFIRMRDALDATGRPIVYSIHDVPETPMPDWRAPTANLWRTTRDITDSWASMISIARRTAKVSEAAGPGHWNDPDMLEVGNGGMTDTENRTHFSLWAQLAAPLILGNDLDAADPATLATIGNRDIIALDQDALGAPVRVIASDAGRLVLTRPLANGDRSVTLTNETSAALTMSVTIASIGLPTTSTYDVTDLWSGAKTVATDTITVMVESHATAMLRVAATH